MDVYKKIIVITGAASGIGRAMAQRFARENPEKLILADLDAQALAPLANELNALGIECNVAHEENVRQLVQKVEDEFGRIDLFCGNAGVLPMGGLETSPEDMQRGWEVNVLAHQYAARAALPGMLQRGGGYFLITVSAAGLLNQPGALSYALSKHAAIALAEWLSISYGDRGIKVSALCPQAVDTNMIAGLEGGSIAGIDGVLGAEAVADCVIDGLQKEEFLILPHPKVKQYFMHKAENYDRWLGGMRKALRAFPELAAKEPEGI